MTVQGLLESAARGTNYAGLDIEFSAEALLAPVNAQVFPLSATNASFSLERISAGLRTHSWQVLPSQRDRKELLTSSYQQLFLVEI